MTFPARPMGMAPALLGAALFLSPLPASAAGRPVMIVMDFASHGSTGEEASLLPDLLRAMTADTGRVTVLPPSALRADERGGDLPEAGPCTDFSCAREAAEAAGAAKVVTGAVWREGDRVRLKVRRHDVKGATEELQEEVSTGYDLSSLDEALRKLALRLSDDLPLCLTLGTRRAEEVFIGAGRRQGLRAGQRLRPLAPPRKRTVSPSGETFIVPEVKIELARVKGGSFLRGDLFSNYQPEPVVRRSVDDFYLGRFEVTQAQWARVMSGGLWETGEVEVVDLFEDLSLARIVEGDPREGDELCLEAPGKAQEASERISPSFEVGADRPVRNVSRVEAKEFLARLNSRLGLALRLPSEDEWEYAARDGGGPRRWSGTNEQARLPEFAYMPRNGWFATRPVGERLPNGLGLFDMSGNVGEWCDGLFEAGKPEGVYRDSSHAPGGGYMGGNIANSTTYARRGYPENKIPSGLGFRVAHDASPPPAAERLTERPVETGRIVQEEVSAPDFPEPDYREPLTGMEFVRFEEKTFRYLGEIVTLSPFYLGRFEVTQAEWVALTGDNPSYFRGSDRPVDSVSWDEAMAFAAWLSEKAGRTFRLPTKVEWWYGASAAGTLDLEGVSEARRAGMGWFNANSPDGPRPVGHAPPNAFGLYDMTGNLWEWSLEFCGFTGSRAGWDPRGHMSGEHPLLLGGSWGNPPPRKFNVPPEGCNYPTDLGSPATGFRLVMEEEADAVVGGSVPDGGGEKTGDAAVGLEFVHVPAGTLERGEALQRGYMGIMTETVPEGGVKVTRVIPGTGAEAAGILRGDVIHRVGGEEMDTKERLSRYLEGTPPGMDLDVHLRREGEGDLALKVTLGTNPEKDRFSVLVPGFYLGRTEVTRAQWAAVMRPDAPSEPDGDLPVEGITPGEVQQFLRRLNEVTGGEYRLPTMNEWEHAAHGGKGFMGWSGTGNVTDLDRYAWLTFPGGHAPRGTRPVGTLEPNPLGLYDMTGNVAELCQYLKQGSRDEDYDLCSPMPVWDGRSAVALGGDWLNTPPEARNVTNMRRSRVDVKKKILGLRLALSRVPALFPPDTGERDIPAVLRFSLAGGEEVGPGSSEICREPRPLPPPEAPPPPDYVDSETGIGFVFVKGGTYSMGDGAGLGKADERPLHQVKVFNFFMSRTEVTREEWTKIMPAKGHWKEWEDKTLPATAGWEDVQQFIGRLNSLTGESYRLPTEAEWEYAARSGGRDEIWAGTSRESELTLFAWYRENYESYEGLYSHLANRKRTGLRSVAAKLPNGLGLYDMSGNVWEWVRDRYDARYYEKSPDVDPAGPARGGAWVARGGHYYSGSRNLRTSARAFTGSGTHMHNYQVGFRLVRSPEADFPPEEDR